MMENKKVGAGFGIIIVKKDMVLLGKRHKDPVKASSALHGEGTWTLPGGKLEFGETFEEGAIRELREETGITLKKATVICVNNDRVSDAHFVTIGMLAEAYQGEAKVMEPDEITTWQYFPFEKLPAPLFPPAKKILTNYLNKTFYTKE